LRWLWQQQPVHCLPWRVHNGKERTNMSLPPPPRDFKDLSDEEIFRLAVEKGEIKSIRNKLRILDGLSTRRMQNEIEKYVRKTLHGDDPNLRDALEKFVAIARLTFPPPQELEYDEIEENISEGNIV